MAKKIRIGDVIEIPTAKGLAYAQFSHRNASHGALLRILPLFFKSRPPHFEEVVKKRESFVVFFPLQAAVNRNIFQVVSNCAVPDFAKPFPLFRGGNIDRVSGQVKIWWLWDGEKEWRVGDLAPEQKQLPLREIWNDTLLIERLESGWTPSDDPT